MLLGVGRHASPNCDVKRPCDQYCPLRAEFHQTFQGCDSHWLSDGGGIPWTEDQPCQQAKVAQTPVLHQGPGSSPLALFPSGHTMGVFYDQMEKKKSQLGLLMGLLHVILVSAANDCKFRDSKQHKLSILLS